MHTEHVYIYVCKHANTFPACPRISLYRTHSAEVLLLSVVQFSTIAETLITICKFLGVNTN